MTWCSNWLGNGKSSKTISIFCLLPKVEILTVKLYNLLTTYYRLISHTLSLIPLGEDTQSDICTHHKQKQPLETRRV